MIRVGVIVIVAILSSATVLFACHLPRALFSPSDDIEQAIHLELQHVGKSVHCSLFGISNHILVEDLKNLVGQPGRNGDPCGCPPWNRSPPIARPC
jgi:hypothetical protein